ncbi:alpha-amylase family glycosyl hydrolase [Yeosuana marina]|uniref:alpha-amylase family glycosyl hydrolase n=1 Tax=Yeosuana marina TaxID=1565536 RepID=UPI0030EDF898|tara:strand:- start:1311 stop:2678 length:1368 start_codon:yes stop_codon:yes gene_type:complete
MKNFTLLFSLLIVLSSCQNNSDKKNKESINSVVESTFPQKISGSTIYEVNIRQFTPEGTFNAFSKHLPRLKELGVDVLWLMPIHPISKMNRKGTLGSYYAPQDYTAVNPEFGTIDDFKALLKKAHDMGFYLIIDWVPNHTGRDHKWITEHPDYYIHDADGKITYEAMSPTDVWWDTALLDHSNPNTRKAMIEAMRYWVELGIDGFRLDHGCGDKIPLYLWEEARAALDPIKDLFWLAECGHETFILDGSYADELEVIMREVAKGEKKANALSDWIDRDMFKYGRTALRMTYTSNHDLNSWVGTTSERFGDAHKTFATFVFTAYGFPLILGGQEVGLSKRLKFFDKDSIDWTDPSSLQLFYKSLVSLKKENPAIWASNIGGFPISIEDNENVVGFVRKSEGNQVIGIFNFSSENQSVQITNNQIYGAYTEYFTNREYTINNKPLVLEPWQYLVFVK